MIPVTKPFLPPIEEYQSYIKDIWQRNWLTNNGPLVRELEGGLKAHLGLDHLLYLSNGTIALQIAIKALDLKGDIITTPFSYVATTSSIVWEGCKPVFVDIDPLRFNIDANKIEAAITNKTTAILATHVFGNPCDVEQIDLIAKKHGLKVIYDAAHAFGVTYKGKSLYEYGDISTTSFHATKLYHTIEGGAVISKDPELISRMSRLRNFGHNGPDQFDGVGVNGKNSEMHAAMGLVNLRYIDEILNKRKEQCEYYDHLLKDHSEISFQHIVEDAHYNYAYYPILLPSEQHLLEVLQALNKNEIYPRRYFYPSLSKLDYTDQSVLPISEDISSRILCLPLFYQLRQQEQNKICQILLEYNN